MMRLKILSLYHRFLGGLKVKQDVSVVKKGGSCFLSWLQGISQRGGEGGRNRSFRTSGGPPKNVTKK